MADISPIVSAYSKKITGMVTSQAAPVEEQPSQDYTLASSQPAPPKEEMWDYKTATAGPQGEPLPANALGWRPDGSPDFGRGIAAFANKRKYMLSEAWKKGWDTGEDIKKKAGYTDDLMPRIVAYANSAKSIGGAIAEPLFYALGLPSQLTEQLAGSVGSALQDMVYNGKGLDEIDWKGNWEASRLAYSNAMRPMMGYDGNLRGEFIRRMNAGERPDLIAEDMLMNGQGNVWIELIGQIGFDPLNAFAKVEKLNKVRRGIKAAELDTKFFESAKAAEMLGDTMKTSDNIAGFKKLQEAYGELWKTYDAARESTKLLGKPGKPTGKVLDRMKDMLQLTPNSRAEAQAVRMGTMWKSWYTALDGNDAKMTEFLENAVRWDKGDEAAKVSALKWFNDSGIPLETIFSRAGNDTLFMTVKMFEEHGGGFKQVFGKLPRLEALLGKKELKIAEALGKDAKGVRSFTKKSAVYAAKIDEIKKTLVELKAGKEADMFSDIYSKVDQNIEKLTKKLAELEKKTAGLDEARLASLAKTDKNVAKLFSQIDEAMKTPLFSTGDQAHYLLKVLKQTVDDVFPSAKSMLEAERKVAEGLKGEKIERLAAMAKELRSYERWLGKLHNMAQDKGVGQLNRMFAKVYLGMSPGYAFRNMSQNSFQMWLDYGPSIFFGEVGDSAIASATLKNGGIPIFAGEHFGHTPFGAVEDMEKTGVAGFWPMVKKLVKGRGDMRIPAENAEAWASRTIVGKTYNRVFDHAMGTMVKDALKDPRFKDLTPEIGGLLEKGLRDNYGDAGLAIQAVKRSISNGYVRLFEDSGNVPRGLRNYIEHLDSVNGWSRFEKEVLTAKTPDEAIAAINKILDESEIKAAGGLVKDITPDLDDPLQQITALGIDAGVLPSTAMRAKQARIYGTDKTVDAMSALTTRISEKLNVLAREQNASFAPIRGWTDKRPLVREKVSLAAEKIIPRGYKAPAEAWEELVKHFGITDNIPVPVTGDEFKRLAWREVDKYSNRLYSEGVREQLDVLEKYIAGVTKEFDANPQEYLDELAEIRKYFDDTQAMVFGEGGAAIVELPIEGPRLGAITTLARRYGMQTTTKTGANLDQYLLNVINKHSGLDFTDLNDDISLEMANRAFAAEAGVSEFNLKIPAIERLAGMKNMEGGFTSGVLKQGSISPLEIKELEAQGYIAKDIDTLGGEGFKLTEKATAEVAKTKPAVAKTGEEAAQVAKSFIPENVHFLPSSPNSLPSKEESIIRNNPFVRQDMAEYIRNNFDKVKEITSGIEDETWALLRKELTGKVAQSRIVATQVAQAHRDFTLINYGRETYRGVLASYMFPYYKWYAGTYGNYARRILRDPTIISHYQMLKDSLALAHSDLPDWYKYNINTDDLLPETTQKWLGLDDNPLFFNIEATIWPLQGLTGVDFNDSEKVVDWWTYSLDQLGKYGPTVWTPMTLATGLALKAQGNEDAGERWIGRLTSLSSTAKSVGAAFGKNVELDPFVLAFEGGVKGQTPYEDNRVRRALAEIMQRDPNNRELQAQIIDAANSRSGPLWDEAKLLSDKNRLLGNVMSTLGGVGMKARTREDVEVDRFYSEYAKLMSVRPNLSPDDFRNQMALLGQKYPFMDTVLIGSKSDDKRDAAFAYNVLARIPPGDMSKMLERVGVYSDTIDKFYENKGDMSYMAEDDRMRFNAAMLSIAATMQIPETATRQEWNFAKSQYSEMEQKSGIATFDEKGVRTPTRVGDMMQTYYDYLEKDRSQAKTYLDSHPDLQQAFDLRNAYIANNPILNAYYGGMETIEKYYQSLERVRLKDQFGENIYQLYDYYNTRLLDAKSKKEFDKKHPELVAFRTAKNKYQDLINQQVASLASKMPEGKLPGLRVPQTETQAMLQEQILAPQRNVSSKQLWAEINGSPELAQMVRLHLQGGTLTYQARERLRYIGQFYGLSTADEVLQILLAGQ